MRPLGHRQRTRWLAGAVAVAVGAGLVLVALVWFLTGQGRERSDQWGSIFTLLLAWVAAVVPVVGWLVRRGSADERQRDGAVGALRESVGLLWSREVSARQVFLPYPLRLRWRRTGRAMVQGRAGGAAAVGSMAIPPDGHGLGGSAGAELAAVMRDGSLRQVVVLGEPGAGKSTLALLYVVAATANVGPDTDLPVPVLCQLGGWDPRGAGGLDDWLVQRIREDYPHLAAADVAWLVHHRKVIAVLDGLDELPAALRGAALQRLEVAAAGGLRMVVTCRRAEFEETTAAFGVLPQAVVVEIERVDVGDAAAYLSQREAVAGTRWDGVIGLMRQEGEGPLAGALSTPLMISLARQVYRAPSSDPGELARLPSSAAVRERLLDRFLPAVYGDRHAARVRRWLAQLIRRLPATPYDPNLAWWRLGATVPRSVIVVLITFVVTGIGSGLGSNPIAGRDLGGTALWALLGLVAGLHAARLARASARPAPRSGRLGTVGAGLASLGSAVAAVSVIVALCLLALFVVARPVAVAAAVAMVDVIKDPTALRGATSGTILPGMLIALVILAIVFGLGAGRAGAPRRTAPRLRALPPALLAGLAWGLLVGLPGAVIGALHTFGWSASDGLIVTVVAAAFTGVPLGLGRWLSSPVTAAQASTSPALVLRRDRTALLLTVVAVTIAVVGAAAATGLTLGVPLDDVIEFTEPVATAVAVLVFFGSGSAWLSYSLARLWLAATGRLPWRLTRFLRDAEHRGVLRRAGDTYQIRHDLLRNHLAGETRPTSPLIRPGRSLSRRRLTALTTAVAVAAAPAAAFVVDSRPVPLATLGRLPIDSSPQFHMSADGRTILAVTDDGTARLWDAATGRPIAVLDRVVGWDRGWDAAQFDATGRTVLTAQDGTGLVRLWNAATGSRIATLDPIAERLPTYSTDGSTVLTIDRDDRVARLWRTRDGVLRAALEPCVDARFSPDGGTVYTVADDATVRLWNAATGAPIAATGHVSSLDSGAYVNDIEFSPDGRILLTVDSQARQARLWNTVTGTPVGVLDHVEHGFHVQFSPDGAAAFVQRTGAPEKEPAALLWDLRTGRTTAPPGDLGTLRTVIWAPGDTLVGITAADGRIGLWTATGRLIAALSGVSGDYYDPSVTYSPDDDTALMDGDDFGTRLVDLHTGRIRYAVGQAAAEAAYSPDGRLLVTVEHNGRIRVIDVHSGRVLATARHSGYSFEFSPDSAVLAVIGDNAVMTLRRLPDYQIVATLDQVAYGIARFSPDGRRVVTVDWTGKLRLWTVPRTPPTN